MTKIATPNIPREVILRGIAHKVIAADGMVMFKSRFGPLVTRIMFERKAGCWYASSDRAVMTSHIAAAQLLIDEWFGADHRMSRGENNP